MKLPFLFSSITVLSISISSCTPSQSAVETAIVQTMTALPTMTPFPTRKPTLTPTSTQTPTVTPTPVRENLGVSLEQIQNVFEKYDFNFELIRLVSDKAVVLGKYKDGVDVYLTAQDSNLVRVDYGIPMYINTDEVPIPSLGDIVFAVLGEDIYQTKYVPWAKNNSGAFEDALCFDGILIKSYYSEWSDSLELDIMVEQEWNDNIGGCR